MGGSILPVSLHNGQIYFLFGKERDIDENPGWSDFGGGTEPGETFIQTAIREGAEELTGFLGNSSDIKLLLDKYGTYNIDYKNNGRTTYRCHIFPMKYDHLLIHYYNNNQQFLQQRLDANIIKDTKIFEKTQIKWFSLDDMKTNRNEFRSFYQNIVDLIINDSSKINRFVKSKLLKHKNSDTKKKRKSSKRRENHY